MTTVATDEPGRLPGLARTLLSIVGLAIRSDPRTAIGGMVLVPASWITGVLLALWLKVLIDAVVAASAAAVIASIAAIALNQAGGWLLSIFGQRVSVTFYERAGVTLENRLIGVAAGTNGIEHLERPEYVDRLDPLRKQAWVLHWTLESVSGCLGACAQLLLTVLLLASVHPALLLLPIFGIPSVLAAGRAALREKRAEERTAIHRRQQRHLVNLATNASLAKEIRTFRMGGKLLTLSQDAWQKEHKTYSRVAWRGTWWQILGAICFAIGFVGSLVVVAGSLRSGEATVGDLGLALVLASTMTANLGMVVEMVRWLLNCLGVGQRFVWLSDRARRDRHEYHSSTPKPVPERLRNGIRLSHVWFRYPGMDRYVLKDVSLALPAGGVVAIVGENGAGKSTLVKLLCGLYTPTRGEVLVEGVNLADVDLQKWRERCAGAFQDHARLEFTVREAVAIGDLDADQDNPDRVGHALEEAGAGPMIARLPQGVDTQLGKTWTDGVELSGGQWQVLALARGLMREDPLLLILDEPTASLDAHTEDELFTRIATAARRSRASGGVTLLVSHRFSTVRAADMIVVLGAEGVIEHGTHEGLISHGGTYAELYNLQAQSYGRTT